MLHALSIAVGAVLVLTALRDVLHTLLHPGGIGPISPRVFRVVWRAGVVAGGPVARLAGPLGMIATGMLWAAMIILGFALVYLPSMPESFTAGPGVPLGKAPSIVEALYVSAVGLSTLGLGDVVASTSALRAVVALEALVGFLLLSAAITWVLSLYPALGRRRVLAVRLGSLLRGPGDEARLALGGPEVVQAMLLHDLADRLNDVRVDLVQYPESAFFRAPHPDLSLAGVLPRLHVALQEDLPEHLEDAGRVVQEALDALADTLRATAFPLKGEDPDDVLRSHAEAYDRNPA